MRDNLRTEANRHTSDDQDFQRAMRHADMFLWGIVLVCAVGVIVLFTLAAFVDTGMVK